MKKITILIALMITSLGFAQQVLIENFEDPANYKLEGGFAGLKSSITPDPAAGGTNLNVLKLDVSGPGSGVEVYEGEVVTLLKSKIKVTTDKTVKVDVYSSVAFTLMCKVEGGTGPNSGASKAYTTPNAWQTLTFTFTEKRDSADEANGEYSKFVFFPNWKDDNTGFKNPPVAFTLYVDNITAEKATVVVPSAPTTAAPTPPVRPAGDVISLYSDAYANVASTFDAGWCGGGSVSEIIIESNKTLAFQGNNCQGIVLDEGIDASSFTRLHVDVYIEAGTVLTSSVFNLKFVQQPGGAAKEINLNVASSPALIAGSWLQVDVPVDLAAFTGFKEFGITSNLNNKIWYDNLYAHKGTLSTEKFEVLNVKMYPNPASNKLTIEAKGVIDNVSLYNVLGQQMLVKSPKLQTATLDISNLQAGIYVVKATIDGKVASSRFVKK